MPDAFAIDGIALNGIASFHKDDAFRHEAVSWLRFDIAEAFADLL
jgi:hypothetical protein